MRPPPLRDCDAIDLTPHAVLVAQEPDDSGDDEQEPQAWLDPVPHTKAA